MTTLDISKSSLFVVTDRPAEPGQLVRIAVILPGASELSLRGMVFRAVEGDRSRRQGIPAGMGIRFYGLGHASRAQWEAFYEERLAEAPPAPPVPTPSSESLSLTSQEFFLEEEAIEVRGGWHPLDRGTPFLRSQPTLYRLAPDDVEALEIFGREALGSGGAVLTGHARPAAGSPVVASVVHPVTKAEFHVPGVVLDVRDDDDGVAVLFLGLSTKAKEDFTRFAKAGEVPAMSGAKESPRDDMALYESPDEAGEHSS